MKTRNEIMDFCQDLDILIIVCTIICVLQILCLCVLEKTRNGVPSSRLYGDRHGLIRKPARILNGRKMDSVQWRISRKQPIEHDEKPLIIFNQVGFMIIIIEFGHLFFNKTHFALVWVNLKYGDKFRDELRVNSTFIAYFENKERKPLLLFW